MENLMPILKPNGYRNDVPLFLKENLFDNPSSPVIAYGLDKNTHIEYDHVTDDADFREKLDIAKEKALENLKSIHLEIQVQQVEGVKLAFITGHEYAAEKILDKEFMIKVAEEIDAFDLMVGIPFKGHLLAIDSMSTLRAKFPNVIIKYFENPQQDVISPHVFLVRKGEIIAIGGTDTKDHEGNSFSYTENTETHNYTVHINCSSVEDMKEMINSSYQQVLVTVANTKEFGGEIIFKIDGEIQDSDEFRKTCKSFKQSIHNNELAQTIIKTFTNNNIKTTFYLREELVDFETNSVNKEKGRIKETLASNPFSKIGPNTVNSSSIPPIVEKDSDKKPLSPEKTDTEIAEQEDYSNHSIEELDAVFYKILSVPNARTHVPTLIRMTKLMDAYEKLGATVPSERKTQRKKATRPENWGKSKRNNESETSGKTTKVIGTPQKKWWEFWK